MPQFSTPRKSAVNVTSPKKRTIFQKTSPRTRMTRAAESPRTRAKAAANSPRTRAMTAAGSPWKRLLPMVSEPRPRAREMGADLRSTAAGREPSATGKNSSTTRQPPRCSKCEGRPLRSQCVHTATGRSFLEHQAGRSFLEHPAEAAVKERFCRKCPGQLPRAKCGHTKKGQAYLEKQRLLAELEENPFQRFQDVFSQQTESGAAGPKQNESPNSEPLSALDVITLSDFPTTPTSETPSSSPEGHPSSTEQSPMSSSPSTEDIFTPCPLRKKIEICRLRRRATMRNPIYGMVQNAKRGNKRYAIYRTHILPKVRQSSLDVSRRFLRQVIKIMQRCEDLSIETGCWLFFGAQHVTARGGAFSYASPRICREAREPTEELATLFNTTVTQLLNARRIEAVKLQRQLDVMEKEKLAAENAFQEATARIARYMARFGALDAA